MGSEIKSQIIFTKISVQGLWTWPIYILSTERSISVTVTMKLVMKLKLYFTFVCNDGNVLTEYIQYFTNMYF